MALASGGAALWLAIAGAGARAQDEPARTPRTGGMEAVAPGSYRDAGSELNTVAPPPPSPAALRCPEPAPCGPDSDLSQIAWLFVGLTSAGMLLTSWWAVVQQRRAGLIREELSRIRMHRTAQIRVGRPLGEVPMPPPGLGRSSQKPAAPPVSASDVAPVAAPPGEPATGTKPGDPGDGRGGA